MKNKLFITVVLVIVNLFIGVAMSSLSFHMLIAFYIHYPWVVTVTVYVL